MGDFYNLGFWIDSNRTRLSYYIHRNSLLPAIGHKRWRRQVKPASPHQSFPFLPQSSCLCLTNCTMYSLPVCALQLQPTMCRTLYNLPACETRSIFCSTGLLRLCEYMLFCLMQTNRKWSMVHRIFQNNTTHIDSVYSTSLVLHWAVQSSCLSMSNWLG